MQDLTANLSKNFPVLEFLNSEQKVQLERKAIIYRYQLGQLLWSEETPGIQLIILIGNVRLVPNEGSSLLLKPGDWLGDLLDLPSGWKARAASKDVQVLQWNVESWLSFTSLEIKLFWAVQRSRYLPGAKAEILEETVTLLKALSSEDVSVRSEAVLALGRIGDENAVPMMCHILTTDKSPEVRRSAAEALGMIGDEKIEA
jgi:hypothetical protein